MADNVRGIHVSPGIYTDEKELSYAVKSLGITTLGLVGETLKGPAFERIPIKDWTEFQTVFGGTNPEKFEGSQYPKYEAPYIAKSYLTESKQLEMVRVLGMSGYNAGPAWLVTASGTNGNFVVAVLRSRGHYVENDVEGKRNCACNANIHDKLVYDVPFNDSNGCSGVPTSFKATGVTISEYSDLNDFGNECNNTNTAKSEGHGWKVQEGDYGRFTLTVNNDKKYAVTLNPNDSNYILKVLGTKPSDGDAAIFVESLYDVALANAVADDSSLVINNFLLFYDANIPSELCTVPAVSQVGLKEQSKLRRSYDLGKRFLCTTTGFSGYSVDVTADTLSNTYEEIQVGQIVTVKLVSGSCEYVFPKSGETRGDYLISGDAIPQLTAITYTTKKGYVLNNSLLVKNNEDGLYYRFTKIGQHDEEDKENEGQTVKVDDYGVVPVLCDVNDYKSAFRYASTPWIVSNLKGDYNNLEMTKMFRFHTISDGNTANNMVKVSITDVSLDNGTFTVVVRDINDSDSSPIVLESFGKCTMVPTDDDYIAYKIGSFDGVYESKSKYITVEVNETTAAKNAIPSGFLGYPTTTFDGTTILGKPQKVSGNATEDSTITLKPIQIQYNTEYDSDVKARRQYFGLSDLTGIDSDMFTYKGKLAYANIPSALTYGFHLDARLNSDAYDANHKPNVTVDGVSGYSFATVSPNTVGGLPIIGTEEDMEGCLYEDIKTRKFTVYFYGGFDGWDEYRTYRTNTDKFKLSNYNGQYNDATGEGFAFDKIDNPEAIGLNQKGITSDWYAYLGGYRQFANPSSVDINVFATPGIDYVNNKSLVDEVIEMVEEERADSIYVVTTPDKPFGASDFEDEMYTPDEAVANLEDSDIDSNYTCTYYPWVKYEDTDNNQYIYLPPTKDVVRNMAMTDNIANPWYAPAGINRGNVECVKSHHITKIDEEDTLYDGRINPIKTFATEGVKVWGQKNLQIAESQLNRIAVRRLILRMRKLIAVACLGLIFDPNDKTMKDSFISTITPIMDNITSNRGISSYRIKVDDSQEARDRHELNAAIYFKPYGALEYINLSFVVTPEGVSFDDI